MNPSSATLVHLSDTHLIEGGGLLHGRIDTWARTTEVLRAAARFSPDAVLVTGDIAERGARIHSRAARLFEEAERILGCPVVVVSGNHDPHGAVGAGFNRQRRAGGPNPADTLHLVDGLRIIGLDTHGYREAAGHLEGPQLDWLRSVLATPAPGGTVLAMHHPPINSLMASLAGRGLSRPEELAAVVEGSDVRGILCGHYHLPGTGNLESIPVWVSPAVSYNHDLLAAEGATQVRDAGWFSVVTLGSGQFSATPVQLAMPAVLHTLAEAAPLRHPALL